VIKLLLSALGLVSLDVTGTLLAVVYVTGDLFIPA
jgi:hypothetical protein